MKSDRTTKWFAIAAIALFAINMRTAVSSVSPIVTYIQKEISLPIVTIGLLGLAAPLAFAIATSLANTPARRIGVEKTLIGTALLIVGGHALRALAWDSTALFAGSLMSLLGMGIGNILLPVLVRKYFPNRVGLVSSFYISLTAISATAASFVAVPVAEAAGWRLSLGQWGFLAVLTLLPLLALRHNSVPEQRELNQPRQKAIWRSPTAWAIFGTQGMTSVFGYVSFAWLPLLLLEHNKRDRRSGRGAAVAVCNLGITCRAGGACSSQQISQAPRSNHLVFELDGHDWGAWDSLWRKLNALDLGGCLWSWSCDVPTCTNAVQPEV